MKKNKIFGRCDIAVNRSCNARCDFCYAKGTEFDPDCNMDIEVFDKIVALCKDLKIKRLAFFGGEPTVFPKIFEYLERVPKEIGTALVTNAILLKDIDLCKKFVNAGVVSFSLSIKAHNRESYKELTHVDKFEDVLQGIYNISNLNVDSSVSYVVTRDNIKNIIDMIKVAKRYGAKRFFFSFCRNFNVNGIRDTTYIKNNNPFIIAEEFEKILPEIRKLGIKFSYSINDPLCVYSKDFIKDNFMEFPFPCHVYNESILSFDTQGNIIPCHSMYPIKIGKIGEDFVSGEDLLNYRESEKYKYFYKKLRGLPSNECSNCGVLRHCYGRCICNWTNYSFEQLSKMGDRTVFENNFFND